MRRTDKEITDIEKITALLTNAEICRLGLIDGDYAYIVPVNYYYENGAVYFHSALKGRKIELMRENNKVSFEIDYNVGISAGIEPCMCTTRYESVMGTGTVEFIETPQEKSEILNKFMQKFRGEGLAVTPEKTASVAVIKVTVQSVSAKRSPAK